MHNRSFVINDFEKTKQQLLIWGSRFSSCCFLDNHQYAGMLQQVECLLAVGARHAVKANAGHALEQLQHFLDAHKGEWFFGHLGYDLKAETENVHSNHTDKIGFPDLYFFIPETIVQLHATEIVISSFETDPQIIFEDITATNQQTAPATAIHNIQSRISKEKYLETIARLHEHILRGDCYELNYCQEFYAENVNINPAHLYQQLSALSPNPFSSYYRVEQAHLVCASPERFLMKKGERLYSQPIKGTSPRNLQDVNLDDSNKKYLQANAKERSENVMVVDLVRNDLSRISKEGSVKVEELFGVYSYPNVHQMISTVSGIVKDEMSFTDIIKASFPMGSMTGAPKKRVIELIEKYEPFKRGLFAGSVGYIAPNGNFDFNVVIRSIFYNSANKHLSFMAGSGITWYSNAEKEYEECLLKATAIRKILEQKTTAG